MKRRLLNALTALSLLLFLIIFVIWLRSFFIADGWSWSGPLYHRERFFDNGLSLKKAYWSVQILSTSLFRLSQAGARYIHIFVPCPLGWGSATEDTIKLARLAVETGLFPLFEARDGVVTTSSPIRHKVPVTEYLKPQKRYAHLFRNPPDLGRIAQIQRMADHNIQEYGLVP